jgi:hypothetical protein
MAILRVTNMFFFFSNCLTENKWNNGITGEFGKI